MNRLAAFYAKLLRRSFMKNKSHFLLNLAGLTLGISCFIFSLLYFTYETSYDHYHVNNEYTTNNTAVAAAVATLLNGADNGGTRLWWDTGGPNF